MKIKVGERVEEEEEDSVGSCVICVGSTGTGKSSTIAKYTGNKKTKPNRPGVGRLIFYGRWAFCSRKIVIGSE